MTHPTSGTAACSATRTRLLRHLIEDRNMLLCEATRVLGKRDSAEDVMQDAALRCLESKSIPDEIDSAPRFLRRMVRNLAIDHLRRDAQQPTAALDAVPESASLSDDPAQRLAGREALRIVARALDDLPKRTREAFLRHRLAEESQKRVAEDLQLSTARVCGMIAEATRVTRTALERPDDLVERPRRAPVQASVRCAAGRGAGGRQHRRGGPGESCPASGVDTVPRSARAQGAKLIGSVKT